MKKQILKLDPVGQMGKKDQPAESRQNPQKPRQPESNQGSSQKSSPGPRNFPSQHTEKPW